MGDLSDEMIPFGRKIKKRKEKRVKSQIKREIPQRLVGGFGDDSAGNSRIFCINDP